MDERAISAQILAGSAISLCLLDVLVDSGAITKETALVILTRAQKRLIDYGTSESLSGAKLIGDFYVWFTKNNV
jgi:superfamily I DNA and/or RNA helicase